MWGTEWDGMGWDVMGCGMGCDGMWEGMGPPNLLPVEASRHAASPLTGFGGGVRGVDTTWPEMAPTVKNSLFTQDPRVFFFMPPTRARLPGLQKIGEKWLE